MPASPAISVSPPVSLVTRSAPSPSAVDTYAILLLVGSGRGSSAPPAAAHTVVTPVRRSARNRRPPTVKAATVARGSVP